MTPKVNGRIDLTVLFLDWNRMPKVGYKGPNWRRGHASGAGGVFLCGQLADAGLYRQVYSKSIDLTLWQQRMWCEHTFKPADDYARDRELCKQLWLRLQDGTGLIGRMSRSMSVGDVVICGVRVYVACATDSGWELATDEAAGQLGITTESECPEHGWAYGGACPVCGRRLQ